MGERKVVIAVDGSPHSYNAFQFYCENIHQKGDLILVIHAFELPTMPAAPYPYGFAYYEEWSNLVKRADDEAKELLESIGRKCQRHNKEESEKHPGDEDKYCFKLFKENGKAGEVICKFAHDEKADMIVMGSRGVGTIRRTFLGSVSDYCVHHAHIPVAVVPPASEETAEAQAKSD
ncbi:uncharacterized protein LOC116307503 [Actinia tenebrosa]|uniref:Uncharacterized protein LOC116307503 n=1 Tax=Actinia tenebrosa TaxID=6105 RepID=A0A6P8J264_ACTTE|nr:uncharacterized protein LOC116307503 [Actinia tenebrosa]